MLLGRVIFSGKYCPRSENVTTVQTFMFIDIFRTVVILASDRTLPELLINIFKKVRG